MKEPVNLFALIFGHSLPLGGGSS